MMPSLLVATVNLVETVAGEVHRFYEKSRRLGMVHVKPHAKKLLSRHLASFGTKFVDSPSSQD